MNTTSIASDLGDPNQQLIDASFTTVAGQWVTKPCLNKNENVQMFDYIKVLFQTRFKFVKASKPCLDIGLKVVKKHTLSNESNW